MQHLDATLLTKSRSELAKSGLLFDNAVMFCIMEEEDCAAGVGVGVDVDGVTVIVGTVNVGAVVDGAAISFLFF